MAGVNVNAWIPVEYGGALFKKFTEASVLFRANGRQETMTARTKTVPKEGDVAVQFTAKGATYGLDNGTVGTIDLVAKKMTAAVPLDDEDIKDAKSFVNVVQAKRDGAVRGFARLLDNAAFCVTGAPTAEPDMTVPYSSLYRQVANYNPGSGAGANIQTWDISSGTAADFRAAVLETIDIAENSEWADDDLVVLANPAFRSYLRNQTIDGSNGLPIWSTAENTILTHPTVWGRGLRKTAVATQNPTGNPLMIVGPRAMIVAGIREQLAWRVTDAQTGIGALSDTSYVLAAQRVAFNIGDASAFGVLELVP